MRKLTKGKEVLYGFSAFGPNLLMIFVTAYIVDAFIATGFKENLGEWTFAAKSIVYVAVFSVLVTIAKIIDGVIDVPLAALTDGLKSRWGRRRPTILIGLVPMILAYIALCIPLNFDENSILNTVWAFAMLVVFFSAYTLCLVTYYGTFSEITYDTASRVRVSSWKAFFDTVSYSIAYALIPLFIGMGINIQIITLVAAPLMLTMIIPLFVIKEPSTRPADVAAAKAAAAAAGNNEELKAQDSVPPEAMTFFQSIKAAFSNKNFMIWMGVFGVFFFGLQMFLAGQNVIASGPMGLEGWQIAIMNTAAFAPVPLMLLLYNKVMRKKGFRFAFMTAILSFALAMSFFAVANVNLFEQWYVRLMIGATGATVGSYGIGAFFSTPYIIPSQIASEEQKRTGKSNPAMYFAVQGLVNAVFAAISTGVVWLNLRNWTLPDNETFGASLMPIVVVVACAISFGLCFLLPSYFKTFGKKSKPALTPVTETAGGTGGVQSADSAAAAELNDIISGEPKENKKRD